MRGEDEIGCITSAIVGIIAICIIIWSCNGKDETGTLYMTDSDVPVCSGTLHTYYHDGPETYKFTCNDGRVINNVTNFILRN